MASFDLPDPPQPPVNPAALLVGAASPLWGYFAAATAGGVAYWWMTQWARPLNLEALLGTRTAPVAPVFKPVEAFEAVADGVGALPVGGEAAPISPLVEAAPSSQPAAAAPEADPVPESFADAPPPVERPPEPAVGAASQPVAASAHEPVIDEPAPLTTEPAPKPRPKKT